MDRRKREREGEKDRQDNRTTTHEYNIERINTHNATGNNRIMYRSFRTMVYPKPELMMMYNGTFRG
jgi:hypothetical protein